MCACFNEKKCSLQITPWSWNNVRFGTLILSSGFCCHVVKNFNFGNNLLNSANGCFAQVINVLFNSIYNIVSIYLSHTGCMQHN